MARNKFIPFHTVGEKEEEFVEIPSENKESKKTLLDLAIEVSLASANLLEFSKEKELDKVQITVVNLKQKLDLISKEISELKPAPTNYLCFTGVTQFNTILGYPADSNKDIQKSFQEKQNEILEKSRELATSKLGERHLDNGGMAPIKEWKSITELNLKNSVKHDLIEEMRKMKEQGSTITKSAFHHKLPINIEEFTEPFRYLENMHDYSGPFLVTLLKSDAEITNQSATLQVDLTNEKNACSFGENIILSIYDITGSISNGEEKKFLAVLLFDKLNGVLKYSHAIFMNGKNHKLSSRQINEIQKFCKTKKINL